MGPLDGLKVVEFSGLGPAPFAAMLLADMGAEVVCIERPDAENFLGMERDISNRGKQIIRLDLKDPVNVQQALQLVERADVLIEGFRPGVMERLGLGPELCLQKNPRLVYGRMTGWGQDGPLSQTAGHDLNYIALSGVLGAFGEKDGKPVMPANLLGDFGGGGMYLAFGIMAAHYCVMRTGEGQVVDAAISDCTAHLSTMLHGLMQEGCWVDQRESNLLDGGAPHYNCYRCADGKWVTVAPIEPKFYRQLLQRLDLSTDFEDPMDQSLWPELKQALTDVFLTQSQSHWVDLLQGEDCCFAPVLSFTEAKAHPHNVARQTFQNSDGWVQPSPAPKFSRSSPQLVPSNKVRVETVDALKLRWSSDKS